MPTSVRWRARACLTATLLAIGLVAVPSTSAAANDPHLAAARPAAVASVTAAQAGAGWIARDVSSSGAVVDSYSSKPSGGDTADAILALVAAGDGSKKVRSASRWLEHNYGSYVAPKGVSNPGSLGLVILAAVAAGANPRRFGGHAGANDLVTRLRATERLHGSSAGVFGAPKSSTAFSQSIALLALAAVKETGAATRLAESYLARRQCGDGGWEFSRPSPTEACTKPDPKSYSGPDTNSTAMAVMAIVALGGTFPRDPVGFFERSQEPDGSFGYYGVAGDGQAGDPDSSAESIQALIALRALGDKQFVRGGVTPERALVGFQYQCHAPAARRGEFRYGDAPSQLATLQAVPAAAGVVLPISARALSAAEPSLSCPKS
jgi:hypothetical protein